MSMQLSTFRTFPESKQERKSPLHVLGKHFLTTPAMATFLQSSKHPMLVFNFVILKGVL